MTPAYSNSNMDTPGPSDQPRLDPVAGIAVSGVDAQHFILFLTEYE